MDAASLLFALLCPLSMVALVGWWAWSMRKPAGSSAFDAEPARSAASKALPARMGARLDQLHTDDRDTSSSAPEPTASGVT